MFCFLFHFGFASHRCVFGSIEWKKGYTVSVLCSNAFLFGFTNNNNSQRNKLEIKQNTSNNNKTNDEKIMAKERREEREREQGKKWFHCLSTETNSFPILFPSNVNFQFEFFFSFIPLYSLKWSIIHTVQFSLLNISIFFIFCFVFCSLVHFYCYRWKNYHYSCWYLQRILFSLVLLAATHQIRTIHYTIELMRFDILSKKVKKKFCFFIDKKNIIKWNWMDTLIIWMPVSNNKMTNC